MFLRYPDTQRPWLKRVDTSIPPLVNASDDMEKKKQTSALEMFSQHLIQTHMSIGSTLHVWHANRNHSPCKWVRGTSFILTGKPLLIDSLFVLKGAAVSRAAEETENWRIFIRCEKGMSSLWCLRKTFSTSPVSLCLCLRCSQIMFPESNLTSGVESFSSLLAIIHCTHQLSWNINWKGKKAVRHFLTYQFDFRQR